MGSECRKFKIVIDGPSQAGLLDNRTKFKWRKSGTAVEKLVQDMPKNKKQDSGQAKFCDNNIVSRCKESKIGIITPSLSKL